MADGGNVTVVEVTDGIVRLRLEVSASSGCMCTLDTAHKWCTSCVGRLPTGRALASPEGHWRQQAHGPRGGGGARWHSQAAVSGVRLKLPCASDTDMFALSVHVVRVRAVLHMSRPGRTAA